MTFEWIPRSLTRQNDYSPSLLSMRREWVPFIPRAGIILFLILATARTLQEYFAYEAAERWCADYFKIIGTYGGMAGLSALLPGNLETWRRHAGKLTSTIVFLLIVTTEISASSFSLDDEAAGTSTAEIIGYLLLSGLVGLLVSALVENLSRHERHMELMSSGLSEALWSVDCKTDEVTFSSSFVREFGYDPKRMRNTMSSWYALVHPEDSARIIESFNLAAEQPHLLAWQELYRVKHADGRYIWVLDRCRFDRDENGVAHYAHGGMLDVTDRVENERKLKELNEQLEHRVEERTRALRNANKDLSDFTYAVTHDMKSPLSGILGYADLMAMSPALAGDKHLQSHLRNIVSSGERMLLFVNELLAQSREERLAEKREPVSLASVFRSLKEEFAPQIGTHGGRLFLPETDLVITGSESPLFRVLQNLIGNAFKYRREDTKAAVIVTCENKDGRVILSINDNGRGIPAEELPRIFDFHFRATSAEGVEGHGIGLNYVKRTVSNLGGEISVVSQPGVGTTFTLTLPLA